MHTRIVSSTFLLAMVWGFSFLASDALADTIPLTRIGLTGAISEGGVIGNGPGQVDEFDVGRYIIVNENLVLRARAEIDNGGGPNGNVGILHVEIGNKGIGAGSFLDDEPGSEEISGEGPNGSEIVSFLFTGDALLTNPMPVAADSVTLQVNKFKLNDDDLAVILFDVDGNVHTFAPSVVEPLLTGSSQCLDLDFALLPGIDTIAALTGFDVRSGILEDNDELSGGHFYVSSVSYTSVPEPAAFSLLALGGLALLRRRRP